MDAGGGAAIGLGITFFVIWFVVLFGGMAVWIWAIVDVARTPDHAYRLTGRDKTTWVLIVALVQVIGGLIWWFGAARKEVKAAAEAHPFPPPQSFGPPAGWYPDPSGVQGLVWWDGRQWTGHRQHGPSSTA